MSLRFGSATIALLAWCGTAVAEEMVVIEGPKEGPFAEGAIIADGKAIELPAGVELVLVGGTGRTVSLKGPYKGIPGASGPPSDGQLMTALASLVKPKEGDTKSIGAVRALPWRVEAATSTADIWTIDVKEGGTQCVASTEAKGTALVKNPILSIPEANMMNVESGTAAPLAFSSKSRLPWPTDMPIEDGQNYLIEVPGEKTVVQFAVQVMPAGMTNDIQRAVKLNELGCKTQAQIVLHLLKKSAGR